jgi:hypothetical protein
MKVYEKPLFKTMDLRLEERIARVSGNCAATHGVGQGCPTGTKTWSGDNDVP